MAKVIDVGAAVLSENDRLREENARLRAEIEVYRKNAVAYQEYDKAKRERDEARAEVKKYHDALVARHGGEPVALLEELDASKAEIERLEGLILDAVDDGLCDGKAVWAEAQRIRAQRKEGE